MMRKMGIGRFLQPLFLACFWLAFFSQPTRAQDLLAGPGPARLTLINTIFATIVRLAIPAAALAFLVMMIVAGFRFLTSGGDPKAVASSRDTLTYSVIGAILMVSAILLMVLIEQITGTQITIFKIGFPNN